MDYSEINQVLTLIDEWVQALEDGHLNEQCRTSGRDFFTYMKGRGVNAGKLARMITQVTGYNPAQLWKIDDAALLRDAIFRYESTQAVTDINQDDQGNLEHFWS